MPIFEYQCPHGHRFEKLERGAGPKTRACPTCGKRARRVFSPAGFILKGGGFYVNDYPSASRKAGMKEETKGSKKEKASDKSSKSASAED